jgi:hypothetical protein
VSEISVLDVTLVLVTLVKPVVVDVWVVAEVNVPVAVDISLVVVTVERVLEELTVVEPNGLTSKRPILPPLLSVK